MVQIVSSTIPSRKDKIFKKIGKDELTLQGLHEARRFGKHSGLREVCNLHTTNPRIPLLSTPGRNSPAGSRDQADSEHAFC